MVQAREIQLVCSNNYDSKYKFYERVVMQPFTLKLRGNGMGGEVKLFLLLASILPCS